ncbi:protein phosphatase 2C domain-containing protein [Hymenobacter wooponensis]|uniref:PPM-type phosphatase domain-containing protein n=1 Tax=Hymenobacter wooponensis TaxID=1525360 RepID=A0A4Z0MIX7_9BACT|nr:protein phosphatase 2C domain-containing protein [Hymenobacter wooponensis]TGD79310.1 hypothetical protein EU557_13795 [Hymenobacter wooponensis]
MKIYQLLKRGEYHTDFCEDFSVAQAVSSSVVLCAVLDGCTMGRESHFEATLGAKILRKVIKERQYRAFYGEAATGPGLERELREIMVEVFQEFRQMRNQLLLDTSELLTTLVIALLRTDTGEVYGMALGDAVIALNGQIMRFEQHNKPNYLAYHLGQDVDTWYAHQKQIFRATSCSDLSLATDGIYSFQPINDCSPTEPLDIAQFLLVDPELAERDEMLHIKVKRLENRFSLKPTDDLAIVRVRLS